MWKIYVTIAQCVNPSLQYSCVNKKIVSFYKVLVIGKSSKLAYNFYIHTFLILSILFYFILTFENYNLYMRYFFECFRYNIVIKNIIWHLKNVKKTYLYIYKKQNISMSKIKNKMHVQKHGQRVLFKVFLFCPYTTENQVSIWKS